MIRMVLASVVLMALAACSCGRVSDYRNVQPRLEVEEFFQGRLTAHGVVKDRGGKVIRTFNADIDASWSEGVGTLVEDFVFDDGETQRRIWTLRRDGKDQYIGTAGDVTGEGRLQQAGNSVFLDYVLQVPYGDGSVDVRVDDRMYLVAPDVLINESRMSKFGWRVGNLILVILRQPDGG